MMKKKSLKLLLLLAALLLVLAAALPAYAAITPVTPSDTLEVCLKTADGTVTLHTYSLSEMRALAAGQDICYSGIDAMPWTVKTVADGVYVADLLDDVAQYTTMDVWDFSKLRFYATDGAQGIFTEEDLFATRYYFAALHEENGGLNEDNEITYDYGNGERVEPMLALSATQQRLPSPSFEPSSASSPERYTLLFGATKEEIDNVTSRVSSYKRGVEKLVIDMGNVTGPSAQIAVTGVLLDQSSASLYRGNSLQLTATVAPANATNQKLNWSSSNPAVATVSATGVVTAVAAGSATISAASQADSSKSATCYVTVSQQMIAVTGISLSRTSLTLVEGSEKSLSATVLPANATDPQVTWRSSDTAVAKVDQKGLITAIGAGSAKITATAGDYSAVCQLTVSLDGAAVTGVSLNRTALQLTRGATFQLNADCSPENAANTQVYWSSSTPGVVSVDTNGLITAKNNGSAVISVSTDDGGFTASCQVTVGDTAASFSDISAQTQIEEMVKLGFISGYTDGSFHPASGVTRAEFLSILIRILQSTKEASLQTGNVFSDTASHWAKDSISTAVALGIAGGYGGNRFGPNDSVTREQIAVMLTKAVSGAASAMPAFSDTAKISSWAVSAVAYGAQQGWISGYSDGSFGPQKTASRAEVCVMLLRFYQSIV